MRRIYTTLLICLMAIGGLVAQSSQSLAGQDYTSLTGKLVDEQGSVITNAKITLANQNISTTVNSEGEFNLVYLDAIDEEVLIEAEGYFTVVRLVNLQQGKTN